jgi:hypothetical protein
MNKTFIKYLSLYFMLFAFCSSFAQQTERKYLSGTGNDHTVNWQFYCTAGRNSGKWTTIPVPSNWELQGFGKYNYGLDKDTLRGKESGMYKYQFMVPAAWKGKQINIVFEGSMTDTRVKINGETAGPMHQGSFYRFKYNVSSLLKYGEQNVLEATVDKHSANASVNGAERKCDFWIFGGIYRPVYLEASPAQHISHVASNARANGSFSAVAFLNKGHTVDHISVQLFTSNGQKAGAPFLSVIHATDTAVNLHGNLVAARQWSPEFPNLYQAVFSLIKNGKTIHVVKQKFGFRTVELREHDGIYVNGTKIKFRGVCRHSFWPSTGRTLSKGLSILDVNLIKDMNMNAVRMSHYPPDDHFLDVCDSLGLFVLDELTGWHHAYDTEVGTKLVKEMIDKDINHPSIVVWDNGNEGGFNFDLDHLFDELDLQKRPLIHPWAVFRGTDTQHYINYDYGNGTHLHGHNIVFPTEFLHGLYDGGQGAGLEDFWEQMWHNPLSAGGFLWDFSDEGVVRTDKNGELDTDGDHGPDGILGPYREKEASYYTVKRVWSPLYIEHREITPRFNGQLRVENRFFYTNLNQCTYQWKLKKFTKGLRTDSLTGITKAPNVAPGQYGNLTLQLPADWLKYDVLYLTARDPNHRELFTWSWPVSNPVNTAQAIVNKSDPAKPAITEADSSFNIVANGISIIINRNSGMLQKVNNSKGEIPFNTGPFLCDGKVKPVSVKYHYESNSLVIEAAFAKKDIVSQLKWTVYPSGWLQLDYKYFPSDYDYTYAGISFFYPEKDIKSITWMGDGPYRVWKNRMGGTNLGVWQKAYNNTITGEGSNIIYPEFKGYYSNFYWLTMQTAGQPFTVVCATKDVYLRLFTPAFPKNAYNTAPPFPNGDISFMHAIPAIGTKSQKADRLGPAGQKNMYYDYGRDKDYAKELTLYFDFLGK